MSAEQWFYRLDGEPRGPVSPVQCAKLIRGGTVLPDTEVSLDGQTWQTLRAALADVSSDQPGDTGSWMNAPTLIPGDVKLPPNGPNKPE